MLLFADATWTVRLEVFKQGPPVASQCCIVGGLQSLITGSSETTLFCMETPRGISFGQMATREGPYMDGRWITKNGKPTMSYIPVQVVKDVFYSVARPGADR